MSDGRSDGKSKLLELAQKVKAKVTPKGDAALNQRGLELVASMVKDLTGDAQMPGLKVIPDGAHKFRLERRGQNGDVTVEWQRDICALVITRERHGEPKGLARYVYDEGKDHFRKMEGGGEAYEDLTAALVECLYPEMR